jgi:hypothetical protein
MITIANAASRVGAPSARTTRRRESVSQPTRLCSVSSALKREQTTVAMVSRAGRPELTVHARQSVVVASAADSAPGAGGEPSSSVADKVKSWWKNAAKIDKKTIASLGSAALLSYGFVSNVFYVTSLMLATYTAVKTTGASPLVNSLSMKTFASSYFGLWMIQNFLRPARFALSVAISPGTDKIVEFFRRYAPNNDKRWAFALTVFCINVVGTFAYMFAGFGLIVALTGVPLELSSFSGLLAAAKTAKTGAV